MCTIQQLLQYYAYHQGEITTLPIIGKADLLIQELFYTSCFFDQNEPYEDNFVRYEQTTLKSNKRIFD